MENGVAVQFAVFVLLAVALISVLIVLKRRKPPIVVERPVAMPQPEPVSMLAPEPTVEKQVHQAVVVEVPQTDEPMDSEVKVVASSEPERLPLVLDMKPVTIREDRNQRILEDISANIRKSMIKPVPTYSPTQFPETPRETEYVRVKKKIITPHGQVRFSILKDSISTNMLALFRRASLEWNAPQDLIGFVPAYLEPETEILNNELLLVGTPGHPEKLAIPIRNIDPESSLRDCFDFVSDVRSATNVPAVLMASSDNDFEVVSRGVVTQPVFVNRAELSHPEVKLLIDKSPAALHA